MDGPKTPEPTDGARDRALSRTIGRTRVVIAAERFSRAFWPFGALLASGWALIAFGLAEFGGSTQILIRSNSFEW